MHTILLLILSILFTYLSYKNLKLSLSLIVFLLPSYLLRFNFFNVPTTLLEIMILIVTVVWLVKIFRKKQKIDFSNYKYLIVIFLLAGLVSVFVAVNLTPALGIYKAYFIESILFFIVFINVFKDKKDLKYILYALGASAVAVSLLAIYQKFTGWQIPNEFWQAEETRRVTSFYGYPNAIGLYLAPIIVLFFGLCFYKKYVNQLFSLLVIVLSFLAIIFAVSEGAIVAVVAGWIIFGLLNKKLRIATIVFLVICLIIFFAVPQVNEYLMPKIKFQDISGVIRLDMWYETLQMLEQRQILGAGLVSYQELVTPYHVKDYVEVYLYPHNIILNFWSETGLAGLFSFFAIVVLFYINAIKSYLKNKNVLQIVLICTMTALLIHGIVDVPYLKNDLSLLFWLIIGLQIIFTNKKPDN